MRKFGIAVGLAAVLAACAGQRAQEIGGAMVQVNGRSGSLTGQTVTLTISDYRGGAAQALTEANGVYTGSFDDIPAGLHQFCASAGAGFDTSCNDVTIAKDSVATVKLVVQQAPGTASTIDTNSPFISAISLSDGAPYYGETITMTATATDPSAAHALAFSWSAQCSDSSYASAVADATQATSSLTTSCHGTETITLQVTDTDQDISSVVSFPLAYSAQGANVSVTVNAWPNITSITTPDAQLNPGDRTTLTVVASDAEDGTNLIYSWAADCGAASGIFNAPDQATTGFLAPSMTGDCKATVTVSDHGGGSTSGSIILHIGALSPTSAVFDAIPAVLAPNYPSQPFQAQQTAEFGDAIVLGGTARHAVRFDVVMSTWARQVDYASYAGRPGYPLTATGWTHPITLNLYDTAANAAAHVPFASVTQTFDIPWRPAGDPTCPDTGYGAGFAWRASDGNCYNGYAVAVSFDLTASSVVLPDSFIYGIAYDTLTWGYAPIGVDGPYDSLNVALVGDGKTAASTSPSIGTDPDPDSVYWNTATAAWYADKGASGVGTFRADTGWTGYAPAVEFFAF